MKIISLFNNKGGVGKTTLTFHLGSALSELGFKVLLIDLDPQCNLTLFAMPEEEIQNIWTKEDQFIDEAFQGSKDRLSKKEFDNLLTEPRTIHFLLKPTEEGTGEIEKVPPPVNVFGNLHIIPGRLSLFKYEYRISERWSFAYQGDPLAIRTITKIRTLATDYGNQYGFDYIIIDTSPSLGPLNKVIITTVDGFIIPCLPDLFSLYGIRNIGNSLRLWKKELETIYSLISVEKRGNFPQEFVKFYGYTIYNAKRYAGSTEYDLAKAHYNFAKEIPNAIKKYIPKESRKHLSEKLINEPIGKKDIMHTHSTLPAMAQKYHVPIWMIPSIIDRIDDDDKGTIQGNNVSYTNTQRMYQNFTNELKERLKK